VNTKRHTPFARATVSPFLSGVANRSRRSSQVMALPFGDIGSLFGRVLVVVAHQDDETACAVLLQRAQTARVVFGTDGAPSAEFFWSRYGSRHRYADIRHAEALASLGVIGITDTVFLEQSRDHVRIHDQELFRCLDGAIAALAEVVDRFKPDALLAPAYEGGHPDHDVCSFLVSTVGRNLGIPRWEMPLYYRSPSGTLVHQQFRVPLGAEILLNPTALELQRRDEMLGKYASQPDVRVFVKSHVERFRPQPEYDYSKPPHPGTLNYEFWKWPMTGRDLCAAFSACTSQLSQSDQSSPQSTDSWAGCPFSGAGTRSLLQSVQND